MVEKMKKICLILLLLSTVSLAGDWEIFSLRENGTVPVWTVAGPFPNGKPDFHGEGCFGYFRDFLTKSGGETGVTAHENQIVKLDNGKEIVWKSAFSSTTGVLDFLDIFGEENYDTGVVYAYCQLISEQDKPALLKIRSNDGVRVWLNDRLVHDHHVGRTMEAEEDLVTISLLKGNNRLLVKVDQGGGKWALSVAIAGVSGKPDPQISSRIYNETLLKNKIKSIKVKTTPLIENTAKGEKQIIYVEIFSGGLSDLKLSLKKDEWPNEQKLILDKLEPGKNIFRLKVPVITRTEPARLSAESVSDKRIINDIMLEKTEKWTLYLVQHVHTDIGYTRPQTEILPEHLRFIDYALDFCDLTDDYPDDAKFRWTCEVSWPVREYLKRRPRALTERLVNRVREGRIEVAGMFLNMSELASETALTASLQAIREINESGIPVKTAMQNDVNGIGWGLVDYFSGIGLRYVTMGINKTRSVLPFDKPTVFWWESPSGERVLAFRADHYHVGNFWKMQEGMSEYFETSLLEYLASLQKADYPFNKIAVQYSGYHTDNSPPSTFACDLVKNWNETYAWPKLRLAVAGEFLQKMEEEHSQELPVYRDAWPDWWTDGFGSAARETAEARITQNNLRVTDGLLAMAGLMGAKIREETLRRSAAIQDALLFYQEHTFGASESISQPLSENSMIQWGEKSSYVWEAVKEQGLLREEALGLLQPYIRRYAEPTLVVYNTLNWPRSGQVKVFIDHEIIAENAEFKITDIQSGKEATAQPGRRRAEGTYWTIWVSDIPAMGFKSFHISTGHLPPGRRQAAPNKQNHTPLVLENAFYKVTLDTISGACASLLDKELNLELVNYQNEHKLGEFIYENLSGGRDFYQDAFKRSGLRNVRSAKMTDGPVWQSITLSGETEDSRAADGLQIEYRLYKMEKKIEFIYHMVKKRNSEGEACYVAFPFQLQNGEINYDAQGGQVKPGQNQLPGSSSDWHTIQKFTSIKNRRGQIVLSTPQIPLVQFGDFNLGKWQYVAQIKEPSVYSWIMNNYWFTNFRAFQEGEFEWQYFLTSSADTSNQFSNRFGMEINTPLAGRVFTAGSGEKGLNQESVIKVDPRNLVLVNSRPLNSESVILHLREIEGRPAVLKMVDNRHFKKADLVNVLGEVLENDVQSITFRPYEVKFVKLIISPQK